MSYKFIQIYFLSFILITGFSFEENKIKLTADMFNKKIFYEISGLLPYFTRLFLNKAKQNTKLLGVNASVICKKKFLFVKLIILCKLFLVFKKLNLFQSFFSKYTFIF